MDHFQLELLEEGARCRIHGRGSLHTQRDDVLEVIERAGRLLVLRREGSWHRGLMHRTWRPGVYEIWDFNLEEDPDFAIKRLEFPIRHVIKREVPA